MSAETVRLAAAVGLAGCTIEDAPERKIIHVTTLARL
jgi:2-methylisocitrate lyase-like PEP mutase family enzyme